MQSTQIKPYRGRGERAPASREEASIEGLGSRLRGEYCTATDLAAGAPARALDGLRPVHWSHVCPRAALHCEPAGDRVSHRGTVLFESHDALPGLATVNSAEHSTTQYIPVLPSAAAKQRQNTPDRVVLLRAMQAVHTRRPLGALHSILKHGPSQVAGRTAI